VKRRAFKLRPPPDPPEIEFHSTVAELLEWMLKPPALYTTFPAGWGKLPPRLAGWLKKCGLKAGMPDILIWHEGRCIGLELKKPGTSASSAQREMHAKLWGAGVLVYVCRRLEDVIAALRDAEFPLRPHHLDGVTDAPQAQSLEITTDGLTP
jgi:hypothetical protein